MADIIVFSRPTTLDLQALVNTTRESISLLKSLRKGASNAQNDLAAKYVEAIKLTISAAQSGHTIANDVLGLAKALESGLEASQVEAYASGMLKLATKSREDATKSLNAFRSIRQESMKLQESRKSQFKGALSSFLPKYYRKVKTNQMEQDLDPTLDKFIIQVGAFITWWDWVTIQTSHQSMGNRTLEFQTDALHDSATVERWNELKRSFVRYNQMICEMEDSDPEFFHLPEVGERTYLGGLFDILKNAGFKIINVLGII